MIRIAAVMIVMTAVVPAAGPADPAQEPAAQEPAPRREHVVLPEEDPAFVELLQRLADRAALYRKYALGFTCREAVTEAKYEIDSGGYRKSNRTTYD
ncbi:MAG TPA: hypothetical protein VFP98_00280, partial [Candidatus Polarisedimenticolia bacterium]|nr:hypothetical protein [Candidatus Polarisedimenticolia bacterium]